MQFIDLKRQYDYLKKKIDARIQSVLDDGNYILGAEVQDLEFQLARFVNTKYAITCANGTDALQLALMAIGVKPGDAVFCPTFTFFATAEAIAFLGATPVFVDVDATSFNICTTDLRKKIEQVLLEKKLKAKAIIAVDLFGLPADYPTIEMLSNEFGLKVIEDAAQGFGGNINGKRAGCFGDIATTSFFPAKPLGCYGDGGALFTNSDELAMLIRSYAIHGKGTDKYDNVRIGMNSRLDTIQAAILLEKLSVFENELDARNRIAARYSQALGKKYKVPQLPERYFSSWAQYTLVSNERNVDIQKLKDAGIPSMIYYKTCMHQQTAFANEVSSKQSFPIATKLSKQVFSLPMHPYLSPEEQNLICDTLLCDG